MTKSNKGWISLHRKLLDWEWYSDQQTSRLWIHLLLKANHETRNYKGKVVPKGSLLTGRALLASETGLTERQIRTSLKRLKSTNEITIETTNKGSHIFITNYSDYQSSDEKTTSKTSSTTTSKRPASDQQATTNNNDNNVNNENKVIAKKPKKKVTKKVFKSNWQSYLKIAKEKFGNDPKYSGKDFDATMEEFLEGIEIKNYNYANYWLAYLKWVRNSRNGRAGNVVGKRTTVAIN